MPIKIDEEKCTGCAICVDVCPVEAITVDQVAHIDTETCIECGACVDECPNDALSMVEEKSGLGSVQSPPAHSNPQVGFGRGGMGMGRGQAGESTTHDDHVHLLAPLEGRVGLVVLRG